MSKRYRDLEIYQVAHKLAVEIHKMKLELPKFEMYEEGRQIRKSSKGIVACIVEGFGRRQYKNDFIRFLAKLRLKPTRLRDAGYWMLDT